MNSPFSFGKIVTGTSFINRKEEIAKLEENFLSGVHTILISPRRWGKSSLVKKVSESSRLPGEYRFCFIDFFRIRNEEEFLTSFTTEVIRSSTGKLDEWLSYANDFLKVLRPKISVGTDPASQFEIGFDRKEIERDFSDVLDLPEKICERKKIRMVICLDEFQSINRMSDPTSFQNRLRSVWQHHQLVTYCIYGSKKHMLQDIFQNSKNPFFRFGDVLNLRPIKADHFVHYITSAFRESKKEISDETAIQLIAVVKGNSNYVQHLAHLIFTSTEDRVTEEIWQRAVNDLIDQNASLFQKEAESLSAPQIGFLKALTDGVRDGFTSSRILEQYRLGTQGNVSKITKALRDREIIDDFGQDLDFADPVFELWFRSRYMNQPLFQ